MAARIILHHPHVELEDGALEYCVAYRLSEPVAGVADGEVGYAPAPGATEAEILDEIKALAVAHANLQTADAVPFTLSDVITWEAQAS
jgi:hypothetical protein